MSYFRIDLTKAHKKMCYQKSSFKIQDEMKFFPTQNSFNFQLIKTENTVNHEAQY